jgi:RHS repeat-associated protein
VRHHYDADRFIYDYTPRFVHSYVLSASSCTGKERDAESGLDYFGARYYASNMGRFMSPDWSAKEEPVPYAKLDNPQSLNLYAYVENNPLGAVDADGHCAATDALCIGLNAGFDALHGITGSSAEQQLNAWIHVSQAQQQSASSTSNSSPPADQSSPRYRAYQGWIQLLL